MTRIMVLYDALVKWILDRSWLSLVGAVVLIGVSRWINSLDALQMMRDFTTYFSTSLESINVFSFVEQVYRAFSGCSLIWDGGLRHVCDGGIDFFNRGLTTVQIPFGSFDVFGLEGGGTARYIKFPLLALAFVVGAIQSLGIAVIAYFVDPSPLGTAMLLGSLILALFVIGGGSPFSALRAIFGDVFDFDGLWELFGKFIMLLLTIFFILIVAALIALGLQFLLQVAIGIFERTVSGIAVFCTYCYAGYKFLKSADELDELAKGKMTASKSEGD